MNHETLKQMGNDPDNVSGIYNYCDYWCERCLFTTCCMNYKMEKFEEKEEKKAKEYSDENNQTLWERLHQSLLLTLETLKRQAVQYGIELDNLREMPKVSQNEEKIHKYVKGHPLIIIGETYITLVKDWFDAAEKNTLFNKKSQELEKSSFMFPQANSIITEAKNISESVEIIRWYLFQIVVKLKRALNGREQDKTNGYNYNDTFPKDEDGSAKVALIGIDRSIGAWNILLQHFPNKEDDLLNILFWLDRLRKSIEKEFPKGRCFVRPGFDEET